MKEFIKIIITWILILVSIGMVASLIGNATKYTHENKAKILKVCLDEGISYQECYSGLNYYQYWKDKKLRKK